MDKIQNKCDEFGMKLNDKKTMVMKIAKEPTPLNITLNGNPLQQVMDYCYLGSNVDEKVSLLGEVKKHIGLSKTAFWKFKEFLRRDVNIELSCPMVAKLGHSTKV